MRSISLIAISIVLTALLLWTLLSRRGLETEELATFRHEVGRLVERMEALEESVKEQGQEFHELQRREESLASAFEEAREVDPISSEEPQTDSPDEEEPRLSPGYLTYEDLTEEERRKVGTLRCQIYERLPDGTLCWFRVYRVLKEGPAVLRSDEIRDVEELYELQREKRKIRTRLQRLAIVDGQIFESRVEAQSYLDQLKERADNRDLTVKWVRHPNGWKYVVFDTLAHRDLLEEDRDYQSVKAEFDQLREHLNLSDVVGGSAYP